MTLIVYCNVSVIMKLAKSTDDDKVCHYCRNTFVI
jgi:hypothetical protein